MDIHNKIYVREDSIGILGVSIWLTREVGGDRFVKYQDGEIEKEVKVEPGMPVRPTLIIDKSLLPELMQQLVNLGVKLPSKDHAEGKLEAQTAHLEDLRHLLELDKPKKK